MICLFHTMLGDKLFWHSFHMQGELHYSFKNQQLLSKKKKKTAQRKTALPHLCMISIR